MASSIRAGLEMTIPVFLLFCRREAIGGRDVVMTAGYQMLNVGRNAIILVTPDSII